MRKLRVASVLPLLLLLCPASFASFRPSFILDFDAWSATHIALVVTTSIDGTFTVLESWKGDLQRGERLNIPELRPTDKAPLFSDYLRQLAAEPYPLLHGTEEIPRNLPGCRMVLFLKSSSQTIPNNPTQRAENINGHGAWIAASNFGKMKVSAVWLDGNHVYSFGQINNPGPSILHRMLLPFVEFKDRVTGVARLREQMTAYLLEPDVTARAELLKPYVHSGIEPARREALEQLDKSGPAAVPTVLSMIDDPAYADEVSELIKILATAGGESVAGELTYRLQRELAFWKATAPTLPQNWWNLDAGPHSPLRDQYGATIELVRGLSHTHYRPAIATAKDLSKLWRSLPQLNAPGGLDQMAGECDNLVQHLQAQ